ncbi:phage protein [Ligilactobacillus agilis]|uniref:Phage protein n=1 Tax=Ligilactobacillus agilis TaxID=1601 RepID=A0A6F9XJC9_9LACO|nr:type II toxin-antitoxin system antitoxin SocA domain-containing protein [Ligilactobacillus agilis]GET05317.1 phage protein [Ligilactobacillus agilis]
MESINECMEGTRKDSEKVFELQNPFAVANFIIDRAMRKDKPVTNLKLQKIMFFLQGYCLFKYAIPLIDGSFSKWRYGAVEEDVYREFKNNGSMPITCEYKVADIEDCVLHIHTIKMSDDILNSDIANEFEKIVDKLIDIESWELAKMVFSHSSWKDFKDEICIYEARDYTNEEIKACFADNQLG